MKIYLCLFLMLGILTGPVRAAETMGDGIKEVSNQVMQNIFDRIMFEKGKHDELSDFEKTNMSLNDHQIYKIEYVRNESAAADGYQPYGFALTILPADEPLPDHWKDDGFEFAFPLLKLKFAGYQRKAVNGRFEIQSAMQRYGQILLEYQQQYMPLQVTIATDKDSYKTNEEIIFTVTVTNSSDQIMRVKPLNSENLYILYDGTKFINTSAPAKGDQQYKLLDPGKSLSKTFHGDAFQFARQIEIYASYNMTFEEVKPFSARKIKIYE